ncbi:DHH family phosphoesterase [Mycoplasma sp. 1654_15]|uniref:DHH family phosphoesterase n=1 Tax=Mycoplasma sp. 1654_15 TaxID=2725994 RepID=UPI001448FE34|nr:bifunctional oligoribonuclease/PAP phosphatase NrnA [Mycoplasma sp. 1654_15]QJB70922.1 bifunctional oligoribonuclease/PAP phosphatase NrnA [Mycoplasma sp. 1654_15]
MKIGSKKKTLELIEQFDSIVIFHHIRPDGDCLGSQFGLQELIKLNYPNKQVFAVGDSKNSFKFLDLQHDSIPSKEILENSLAIIVDANFKERIEFAYLLNDYKFKAILRIDHHPNEDDLNATHRWVDSSYIASAEQIADLAKYAKWQVNQRAANLIYLGIYTDSGRFLFSNTSSRTLELSAMLWKKGADKKLIHTKLSAKSLSEIEFETYVYSKIQKTKNVIYFVLNQEELKKLNKTSNSASRPNLIANIDEYKIWISFVQEENTNWRVEFRSNGPIVRNVAIKWNGGGHELASGAIIFDEANIKKVVKDCQEEYENWKVNN